MSCSSPTAFARYQLIGEPALAMLAWRRDSWVFQDASVIDILTELLTDYQGRAQLFLLNTRPIQRRRCLADTRW